MHYEQVSGESKVQRDWQRGWQDWKDARFTSADRSSEEVQHNHALNDWQQPKQAGSFHCSELVDVSLL